MRDNDVRIRCILCKEIDSETEGRMYEFANTQMKEDYDHFLHHIRSNDEVHLFEVNTRGAIVGFQFWKCTTLGSSNARAIFGGKLRIAPEFRNRGLHFRSGAKFFFRSKLQHPTSPFYILALASIFGFVSVTSALAEYHLLDPRPSNATEEDVWAAFLQFASASDFQLDTRTGLAFVDIYPTIEVLSQFGPEYYQRPEAVAYESANPNWRTNGKYVAYWFRVSSGNAARVIRTIWRKRRRSGRSREILPRVQRRL